jgi:hypothetical protein
MTTSIWLFFFFFLNSSRTVERSETTGSAGQVKFALFKAVIAKTTRVSPSENERKECELCKCAASHVLVAGCKPAGKRIIRQVAHHVRYLAINRLVQGLMPPSS